MPERVCRLCGGAQAEPFPYPHPETAFFRDFSVEVCQRCGSAAVAQEVSGPALARYYAEDYGRRQGRTALPDPPAYFDGTSRLFKAARSRGQLRLAARFLGGRAPGRILDVGAGLGTTLYLAKASCWPGADLAGIEPDPTCRPYLAHAGIATAGAMSDLEKASVDLVICSHTLEHVPASDVAAFASGMRRLLRPGGLLVGEVPHADFTRFPGQRARSHEPHLLFFTPAGIRALLERAAFRVRFVDTVGERIVPRTPPQAAADKLRKLGARLIAPRRPDAIELYGGPRQAIRFVATA